MARDLGVASLAWLGAIACLLHAPTARGQETPERLTFPSEASAITVDVVVLDDDGQPVRGLTRDEFTVREDGRVQSIVGFEARDMDVAPDAASEPSRGALSEVVADNLGPGIPPGRVFALLIDDLGISPAVASEVKPALEGWIRDGAHPRDEITITTTSGELWWSDVVSRGRGDLMTVLDRFEGRRLAFLDSSGGMSEWEAYRILFVEGGETLPERLTLDVVSSGGRLQFLGSSVLHRVLQRWYDRNLCDPQWDPVERCASRIQGAANSVHHAWRLRAEEVYAAVARLSRSLQGVSGRKSILLVSEDFIQDTSVDRPFRDAIDASQRANTAIYFLGARGLEGMSAFSVAQDAAPRSQDVGMLAAEDGVLATAGAEMLAEATGGALTRSNDLAAGLERMALDSSAYYLLGYQPESPPDGKWHDLGVDVGRKGVRVLARKGYRATPPEDLARIRDEPSAGRHADDETKSKRRLAVELLSGGSRSGLPLRLAAYVRNHDGVSRARVQVVVEIDHSRVQIDRVPTPSRATLDFTILAAGLERPPLVPFDERLHVSLRPGEIAAGWWLVPRDVWLPPGVTQLRVFVRDTLSGLSGLATLRLVVPDVNEPYLSTPLLTDRVLPTSKPGELPQLVPTARRRFSGRRPLYCEYEVFTFGGQTLRGVPQLLGSYLLRGPDGRIVSSDQPTSIETDGHRAVRRVVLPVEGLPEGPYVLTITVDDRLAHHTLVARVPFAIEPGQDGQASRTPPGESAKGGQGR